jgi:hypothetical protein
MGANEERRPPIDPDVEATCERAERLVEIFDKADAANADALKKVLAENRTLVDGIAAASRAREYLAAAKKCEVLVEIFRARHMHGAAERYKLEADRYRYESRRYKRKQTREGRT